MSTKRKPGRPRLPKSEALGKLFAMRLTPQERRAVGQAAKVAGKTPSAWARELLVTTALKARQPPWERGFRPVAVLNPRNFSSPEDMVKAAKAIIDAEEQRSKGQSDT